MKQTTIGQKVASGFAALIALSLALSGVAVFTMHNVETGATQLSNEFVPETGIAAHLNESVGEAQLSVRSYGLTADSRYLDETRAKMVQVHQYLAEAHALAKAHPALVKLRSHLDEMDSSLRG